MRARRVLEFRILGPFEVVADGRQLPLGGRKQRALLALLVLHRGEPLTSDRLIDLLWGERPPATAQATLRMHVANLRKVLGGELLLTGSGGYRLARDAGASDADRFQQVVEQARAELAAGGAATARELLEGALALWRGEPLADLGYEQFAQSEITRLKEARLVALEDRVEAGLALGDHRELVGELEALTQEHPHRERLLSQLMLALYRSGRHADALDAYRGGRRVLQDELGLEPGPELRRLEQQILDHDPVLEPPGRSATANGVAMPRRVGRGRALIAAGGVLLVAAAIAAGAVALGGGGSSVRVAPNTVAVISPSNDRVSGAVAVGTRPGAIAFGSGSLWVANQDDQTVSRVDPQTLSTLRTIAIGDPPTGVAAGAGGMWVAASDLNPFSTVVSVVRIDPQFNVLGPVTRIGNVAEGGPGSVAAQGDQVWAAPSTGLLTRLDGTSGRVVRQLDPNASPSAIAIGDGAVWITDSQADNVTRVDPTGLLTAIAVGNGPSGIAVGEDGVWVADSLDNAVVRIDPGTRAVSTTIRVGDSPAGVAVGAGSVWVADSGDGTVDRIDPATDRVIATIPVGGSPQALTVAAGRVWVTIDSQAVPSAGLTGSGTLRIDMPSGPGSMDPAFAYDLPSNQLLQATCAKLMNYPDQSGPAGSQPAPEVAQSLPTRSADGTTYTFKIRPGFRFSPPSNEPVTAQTFKDSLERALNPRLKSPLVSEFSDIVGISAYEAGTAAHISGIVARADTLTIRLLEPRPDLLGRLADTPACAVPTGTPVNPNGVRVIPMAGPYYVQSYTPGQALVLARNPNYHGSRPRHFERIEVTIGMSTRQAVAAVNAGSADYTPIGAGASPSAGLSAGIAATAQQLAIQYGPGSAAAAHGRQRYFVDPVMQLDYFVLNTHRPLFSDLRLRQAANYAIDRRALAALGSGYQPLPEHPTDHYLPPGMPGYRNTHVYPLTPDPLKARQLADGNGRTAVLYTCNVAPCPEQAQIVKTDLAAIGLHVEIKTYPANTLANNLLTPGEPFDLAWVGWISYPDPYGMLNAVLENSTLVEPTFNDPTYARKLAAAARLSGPQRYLTYGNLDLDLARNGAPLAAFGNLSSHDFFSARIGCQTNGGINGVNIAALCLKRNQ